MLGVRTESLWATTFEFFSTSFKNSFVCGWTVNGFLVVCFMLYQSVSSPSKKRRRWSLISSCAVSFGPLCTHIPKHQPFLRSRRRREKQCWRGQSVQQVRWSVGCWRKRWKEPELSRNGRYFLRDPLVVFHSFHKLEEARAFQIVCNLEGQNYHVKTIRTRIEFGQENLCAWRTESTIAHGPLFDGEDVANKRENRKLRREVLFEVPGAVVILDESGIYVIGEDIGRNDIRRNVIVDTTAKLE